MSPFHASIRLQNDKDKENFKKFIEFIDEAADDRKLGVFQKDDFPGEFASAWKTIIEQKKYENVDISSALGYVMAPKEENEIVTIRKAANVSVDVFNKYLKENLMEIIDADKVISSFD